MEPAITAKPGLFSAIAIGIGCMIGSGWLFSAYYAAKFIGPAAYLSWLIGAGLALILALLLAEMASMFRQKALFSRLLTISHNNPDLGFVVSISSWLGMVIVIPAEATATVQYLSTALPSLTPYLFIDNHHTFLGQLCIVGLVCLFSLINFWGIQSLAKASNAMAVIKIVLPTVTALLLIVYAFHTQNFSSQGFAPMGYARVFSGVVSCGIFYAFFGFAMVAMYSSELDEPQKNIPRALIASVIICLLLYLLLQTAFIGALPTAMVAKGWSALNFTSPLAQLLILLNVHVLSLWSVALYIDSALSPSGTGIIYMGSSSRTLTGMSRDKQLPAYFDKVHPTYRLSRRSLLFTTLMCCLSVFAFKNWQEIMIVVTVFQLISCVAIPVAFVKLRVEQPQMERLYRTKGGLSLSYFIYLVIAYLMTQASVLGLVISVVMHLSFFLVYSLTVYKKEPRRIVLAFLSSVSIFSYMGLALFFGYLNSLGLLGTYFAAVGFIIAFSLNYWALLHQKSFH